ncbi:invasion associated locus B family protein [Pseudovibrio sp. Tun.PSC04-5.I4]|uniref:invasion associated locus B family protein n=1 Tax=Pseudovibrio sp. Tun.PSC04-5.I4 TaxID=1798213 RepID=UPI0008924ADB|nr:invasion associated locus B family protein [Pseudovibrio sp. Tun.PSC04-5.I4]SDQ19845.1 Invasion protein IalB, involved in pathogenesis [Pseudovibrio sp. Tun.PSC04-5.I4]
MKPAQLLFLLTTLLTFLVCPIASAQNPKSQWNVQCSETLCQLYAEIRHEDQTLFHSIMFRKFSGDVFAGVMTFPFGTYIPDGIVVKVDKHPAISAKIITCTAIGCEAAFKASKEVVRLFQRGKRMSVILTRATDRKRLALHYSLDGFTKNWRQFASHMAVQTSQLKRGKH